MCALHHENSGVHKQMRLVIKSIPLLVKPVLPATELDGGMALTSVVARNAHVTQMTIVTKLNV